MRIELLMVLLVIGLFVLSSYLAWYNLFLISERDKAREALRMVSGKLSNANAMLRKGVSIDDVICYLKSGE